MDTKRGVWQAVHRRAGFAVPAAWRCFFERAGNVQDVLGEVDSEEREDALARLVELVKDLRASGVSEELDDPVDFLPTLERDERWQLLAELETKWDSERVAWAPVQVDGIQTLASPFRSMVIVAFDSRLSFGSLVSVLRAAWPDLRKRGYTRRTRPLGARAVALVRFVCLAGKFDISWAERCAAWNKEHPQSSFSTTRAFTTAFHHAEKALVGESLGLACFYDSAAWAGSHSEEFDRLRELTLSEPELAKVVRQQANRLMGIERPVRRRRERGVSDG